MRIERLVGEDMDELIIRSNHTLSFGYATRTLNMPGGTKGTYNFVVEWGGHVARLKKLDPTRLTYRVYNHWNYNAIGNESDQYRGKQHHGRCLDIWRWEYYMYFHLGRTWFDDAQNRDA